MIKIHEKLWYIINAKREDNLAYMCPVGVPSSFAKMVSTGCRWAVIPYVDSKPEAGIYLDNTPVAGFYIGSSVCRWSTSNKLFRVLDPRGFTVEVPTDNIATLLHHCTVVHGVVQEECVWGREGNSHILLPVNSEPYLDTLNKMDILENKLIPVSSLKAGDVVEVFGEDTLYQYFGRIKVTYKVTPKYRVPDHSAKTSAYSWYTPQKEVVSESESEIIKDTKFVDVFLYKSSWSDSIYTEVSQKKIVKVLRNESEPWMPKLSLYAPDRVKNRHTKKDDCSSLLAEIVEIEHKK